MGKSLLIPISIFFILTSCEEVITLDLNSSDPEFVIEAILYKDSVTQVHLTRTSSYFSPEEPVYVEDAVINISDGTSTEVLNYIGNGYYEGFSISGNEGQDYLIEIICDGITYAGVSNMPLKTDISSILHYKTQSPSILNPDKKTIFTISCEFADDPDIDNFYMIRFISDDELLGDGYYLLTEQDANQGVVNVTENKITFSESIFFNGGEVEVQVFSVDKSVFKYFMQLNDVLFWKRRLMPPTPYNPVSNISNGALGYFAVWSFDSEKILLQ
jgi:hypothetical protein